MPNAKNNAKLTGDTHPPEVDEALRGLPGEEPRGESSGSDAGQPGRDENAAGFVKEKDLGGRSGPSR